MRSIDGEVVLRQSLSSVGKSGSQHRFLYLFVEVYGILILHPVPAHGHLINNKLKSREKRNIE